MFDIGWTELLVIGVVALIVVGPKDLPGMFRTLGKFTAKAKGMAREFQRAMDRAADEAGVKEVSDDLKTMTSARNLGLDTIKDAAAKFEKWEPGQSQTVMGSETAKLAAERAKAARKIHAATAEKAQKRLDAAKAAETAAKKAVKKAEKKPAKKRAAAKKPPAKKPAVKAAAASPAKAAAKKATAKQATAKKATAKKATAKKSAAKNASKKSTKKPAEGA